MKIKFVNGCADEFEIVKAFEKENPEISIKSNGIKNLRYHEFNVYFKGKKIAVIKANTEGGFTKDNVKKFINQLKGVKRLADMRRPKVEEVEFDI